MAKKYFVTRHRGAIRWAAESGLKARKIEVENFDPEVVQPGDVVMGTLPVHLAARVNERGGHYWHLTMSIPPDRRGQELSSQDMRDFNARLEEFQISGLGLRVSDAPDIPDGPPHPAGVQLCIASDQTLQNVLVMKALPGWKVLAVFATRAMKEKAKERLKLFADKSQGQGIHIVDVPDGLDYEGLRALASKEAAGIPAELVLDFNLTGGTKLMAMAFADAFRARARLLYCDTDAQQIQVLDSRKQAALPLAANLLDLNGYLAAQGYRTHGDDPDHQQALWGRLQERSALTATLVLRHRALAFSQLKKLKVSLGRTHLPGVVEPVPESLTLIGLLHKLGELAQPDAKRKKDSGFRPWVQIETHSGLALLQRLFEALAHHGIVEELAWGESNERTSVSFKLANVEAAEYLSGGYLEEYVGLCLLHSGLPHTHFGLNVNVGLQKKNQAMSHDTLNELDAAVVWRNRLWAFECKAGVQLSQGKGQDILNKLDRLKAQLGGMKGHAWLLSLRPLDDTRQEGATVLERASQSGIKVLHGHDALAALPELLQEGLGLEGHKPWKPGAVVMPGFRK